MEIIKEKILARHELQEKKRLEAQRLKNAQKFFRQERNQRELIQANKLLIEITDNLEMYENKIQSLDMQIMERMELFATGDIVIKTNEVENDLHERIPSTEFVLNLDSVEDLWIAKTAKKFFGVDFNNIEIRENDYARKNCK